MPPQLIVTFPGVALLEQREHLERGGLFLRAMEPMPQAQSQLSLRVRSPYGGDIELETTVVQVFPGTGFALTLGDVDGARRALEPLFARAETDGGEPAPAVLAWAEAGGGAGVDEEAGADESAGAEVEVSSGDHDGTLFDRIRAMSTRDRMQLARHGDRAARTLLMKDTTKTIHVFLVQNKSITADEVRYFAGMRQANPEALKMIAENRTWMQKPAIVSALVRNPKTPPLIAVRLLDKLPRGDIARIAKTGNAPRAVVDAAKRKINSKR